MGEVVVDVEKVAEDRKAVVVLLELVLRIVVVASAELFGAERTGRRVAEMVITVCIVGVQVMEVVHTVVVLE